MIKLNPLRAICSLVVLCVCASTLPANSPALSNIVPRGGQRGTEIEVVFHGARLLDAQEVLLHHAGITLDKLEVVNAVSVKAKLKIAPDCRLGEHAMRIRTASGVSELHTFWVGAMPEIAEVEPNTDFSQPQKIGNNVTVSGVIDSEDVDYFAIEAKKGQRITAELEGMRLANFLFDPYLSIMDASRFDLAAADDSALLVQDPIASIVAPADGTYIIQIRDSAYGGNATCFYRLHIGDFPRPRTVFPAGGKTGADLSVSFLGDVAGPMTQAIKVPADRAGAVAGPAGSGTTVRLFAEQDGKLAPSPCYFRVSEFDNLLEAEPNNDLAKAKSYAGDLPAAFNGVISEDKDVDWFRFKATKGQVIDCRVLARQLRSPLDPVLVIANGAGAGLVSNDDSGGPDSYVRFTAPEDGEYTLYVYDQLLRGYPDGVYRVELTLVKPHLTISIPSAGGLVPTQERQAMAVPRGNRFATLVRATRADFAGEITVEAPGLPAGVSIACENVHPALDVVPVVFEAAPDATLAASMLSLSGKPADPNLAGVASQFLHSAPMTLGANQIILYQIPVDRLAVAVTEEAPFKVQVVQPKVPLVQDGQLLLKVICERKPGFAAPINLRMLFDIPGTGSGQVAIPGDQNEILMPVNANSQAVIRKWKTALLAFADVPAPAAPAGQTEVPAGTNPGGVVWVSSQLFDLDVALPVFTGKIDMGATEQGKPAQVLVHLENKTKFDGEATLKLIGLPNGAKADDVKVKASDTQAIFNVTTDATLTPVGQHNTLFCQLIVPKEDEQIVQSLAVGGVLRVDAPPPPAPNQPAAPAAAPADPEKPPAKPLSRLEKLRLEQQQRQAGN